MKKELKQNPPAEPKIAQQTQEPARVEMIAFRKACKAQGTGLSHYILLDQKGR